MEIGMPVGSRLPHWIAEAPEVVFWYNGDLAVDDVLEIDAEKLLVEKNDTNDRQNFTGHYLELPEGDITLRYIDDETSRTVKIDVIRKDRHI